ncbi:MAG: hypothetical protein AB7V22_05755 [Kiritimatiellia bacterium]
MCYMLFVSTDCAEDLATRNTDLVRFEKPDPRFPAPPELRHAHVWYVGSKSGCSCTFRHLCRENVELGFREPENWFPEKPDAIAATKQLHAVLAEIVGRGGQVDLADTWCGEETRSLQPREVSLSQVPADRFRLFEGWLFTLKR